MCQKSRATPLALCHTSHHPSRDAVRKQAWISVGVMFTVIFIVCWVDVEGPTRRTSGHVCEEVPQGLNEEGETPCTWIAHPWTGAQHWIKRRCSWAPAFACLLVWMPCDQPPHTSAPRMPWVRSVSPPLSFPPAFVHSHKERKTICFFSHVFLVGFLNTAF